MAAVTKARYGHGTVCERLPAAGQSCLATVVRLFDSVLHRLEPRRYRFTVQGGARLYNAPGRS
jgi:hypothetical protein